MIEIPIDLAIPMQFNGPQPNTYGVPAATAKPYQDGHFIGDVNKGGSCNFETYVFTPHCNGTHTECIGHIASQDIFIHEVLVESFFQAAVLSVAPVSPGETPDSYDPAFGQGDLVIDKKSLVDSLKDLPEENADAWIIRSLPNAPQKQERDYMKQPPPFFSNEAMQYIVECGVKHLLVDMPSVDRLFDEGKLTNHHIFWNVPEGSHEINPKAARSQCTITEMIYVPNSVSDGMYKLEIQIAPFMADAAPSRPRLLGTI